MECNTEKNKISFIGGDERMLFAAGEFARDGFDVSVCGFDISTGEYGNIRRENELYGALDGARYVILPLPYSRDGANVNAPFFSENISVADIFATADERVYILGGMLGGEFLKRERTVDYYAREDFAVLNSVPTAEGAVKFAVEETKRTLCGMNVAVLGFGRVGKVLAKTLTSLGANVTVFARSAEARAWAKVFFCRPLAFSKLYEHIGDFGCIFNTVPQTVMGERELARVKRGSVIIELASAPYGVDAKTAERMGVRVCPAPSLPGRITPKTAGNIIYETLKEIMEEEK